MGSNASPSPEEEIPDRMSVDSTSVSPVLDPNQNPMDEADLPDVGAISLSSPDSLSAGFDGSGERATPRKKKKKKNASASDTDESNELEEPVELEEIPTDVEDPTAHISYFCIPKTLFENHKVGPGIEPLGLPVGVYKNDPFEPSDFSSDMTIESRLEHCRLVLEGFIQDIYVPVDVASLEYKARAELAQLVVVSARPASGGRGEQQKACIEENRYYIPFYRNKDDEGKYPAEEKAKVAQLIISALNAYYLVPFAQFQIMSGPIDEHSLQELTWNFLWQADVICAVRDQILADHNNSLFLTDKAVSSAGPLRGVNHILWIVLSASFLGN
ncbi:unnamed protein product [Penicillium discolor]